MNDEDYMRKALVCAEEALKDMDFPIGCVIVLDGEIISEGRNRVTSTSNRLAHAEMEALQKGSPTLWAIKKDPRAVLYTTYAPCPMCFSASTLLKIRKIVYGTNLDRSGALELQDSMPEYFKKTRDPIEIVGGILERECREVFMKSQKAKNLLARGLIKLE